MDQIGGMEDAVERLRESAGLTEARLVRYHRPHEWVQNVYSSAPAAPELRLDLKSLIAPLRRPGFHYLWWPGTP